MTDTPFQTDSDPGDADTDASEPETTETTETTETQPLSDTTFGDAATASSGAATASSGAATASADVTAPDAESLQRDLSAAADRHLRLAAEFDNYRRRVDRERADAWGRAQGDLAKHLLDPIDDLERVAHHAAGEVNYQALLEGVQLVEKKLRTSLTGAGLEFIDAEGAKFDPNTMEAVAMVAAETPEEDDTVADVFQRGYSFKGTLLRPARVRVKKYEG